jgi:glycosyltransferase involved in cell wall biosynthesis
VSTPFLLVGDHPRLPSGLGRILRDLAQQLANESSLDLDVRVVGCRPAGVGEDGFPGAGIPVWSFLASDDQSQEIAWQVQQAWRHWWDDTPGVVLGIWDPARLHALAHAQGPWETWGYLPIDAPMMDGGLTGPPAETVCRLEQVLAYGRWGGQVLKGTREKLPYLPHGLESSWWSSASVTKQPPLIGCVMTNQPRKDWATAFQAVRELRKRGHKVQFWAHTDRPVGAWNLPDLMARTRLTKCTTITLAARDWTDTRLREAYQTCGITILPSLGEGFGYPIVESLASGTPCVHTTFGGGAELVPRSEWRIPERAHRVDGPYGIVRPVLGPQDLANAIERVWAWQARWPDHGQAYCRGSVRHLDWRVLWPRWVSWVKQGLEAMQ